MIAGLELGRSEPVRARIPARREADTYLACTASSHRMLCDVARVDERPGPLLIRGETGTGKTLLVRTLHRQREERCASERGAQLHVINCAALHDALLDEVLAPLSDCSGDAHVDETVLLDEVGELSPRAQSMLLERLEIRRLALRGAQFVATTQRDLDAMTRAGRFSRALLEALSGNRVVLAPLRERREEIVPLALHFLRRALAASQRKSVKLEPELLACIERHGWPGNARELQNAMLNALALNDSDTLGVEDLPESVRRGDRTTGAQLLEMSAVHAVESRVVYAYGASDES